MMNPGELIRISRTLSYALRHKPAEFSLQPDAQGWCPVAGVLEAFAAQGLPISREMLEYVVEHNDKKRFSLSDDGMQIRANQGHSIPIDLGYEAAVPPEVLYHGTAERFLESILQQGLQKRRRHHVHLSADRETALRVGQRHGKPVVLTVRSGTMQAEGCIFYRSANGVWLTDEVPVRYIKVS